VPESLHLPPVLIRPALKRTSFHSVGYLGRGGTDRELNTRLTSPGFCVTLPIEGVRD
jgi:hypothetical protein